METTLLVIVDVGVYDELSSFSAINILRTFFYVFPQTNIFMKTHWRQSSRSQKKKEEKYAIKNGEEVFRLSMKLLKL
jgi:hypothetical protein